MGVPLPLITAFSIKSVTPFAISKVIFGGMESSSRFTNASTSPGRLVKIFMRRGYSTGVSRPGVLDSGCHVADRAQAELGRGRAERCFCLGGFVLHDNARRSFSWRGATSLPQTE